MEGGESNASETASKTVMGKYQLGRLLGRGCFAKVYYARSLTTNTSVAIKIIDKLKTHPSVYPRILGEVTAMRRLDHPNILRIHEVMATKQKIYLVMELAKGGDLAGKLSRRPDRRFPEPLARRCFHQLVSALRYCHLNGVVHRDIKPQNLLLDGDGNIKVSDFGLSAVTTSSYLLQTACGTPAFAAPEVVGRTQAGYDGEKADAWSCGVMLFVVLTGSLPFDHANLALMYRKMRNKEYRFPSWVSKPARGLITRLLDPTPETRMSVEEVVRDGWLKNQGMVYPRSVSLGDLAAAAALGETEKKPEKRSRTMERTASMNAFEIISMSSGLNLSGLFEATDFLGKKRDKRLPVETVIEEAEF